MSSVKLQTSDENTKNTFFKKKKIKGRKIILKILKGRRLRIDPCGKHVLILHHELNDKPILVLYFRLVDSLYLYHNNGT